MLILYSLPLFFCKTANSSSNREVIVRTLSMNWKFSGTYSKSSFVTSPSPFMYESFRSLWSCLTPHFSSAFSLMMFGMGMASSGVSWDPTILEMNSAVLIFVRRAFGNCPRTSSKYSLLFLLRNRFFCGMYWTMNFSTSLKEPNSVSAFVSMWLRI